jgi:Domain of unknown function DUF29
MSSLAMLYETDFHAWALEMAQLIKTKQFDKIDVEHLSEEVESMGASERNALESRLIELMQHLLKWQFQPERKGRSWKLSIDKQRIGIDKVLKQNPSLKHQYQQRVDECYVYAKRYAAAETKLPISTFPETCPYSVEQLFDFEFLPS